MLCLCVATGCGAPVHTNVGAAASPTAVAAATQTAAAAQPVVLAVSARAEGTVADSDLTLRTAVAVTNHTSGPIKLTRGPCAYPLILLDLYDTSGTDLWHNYLTASSCPDMSRDDEATVAPGATYTWTETDRPPITGPFQVRPGAAYTLKADLMQWHQGALAQIGQAGVPQGQHVLGQTTVTFQ